MLLKSFNILAKEEFWGPTEYLVQKNTFPGSVLTFLCVNEPWPAPFASVSPSLAWLCLLPTVASCVRSLALFLCLWVVHVSLL